MALSVKKGNFTLATTDIGDKQISGVGFQPKAVLLWSGRNVTSGTVTTHSAGGIGAMTENTQGCVTMFNTDAAGTALVGGEHRNDAALRGMSSNTAIDWALNVPATAMHSDGFNLNVADAPSTNVVIQYLAFGGTDITDVVKGYSEVEGGWAIAETFDVTGVGFQPDFIIFFGSNTGRPLNAVVAAHGGMGIGFAKSDTERVAVAMMQTNASGSMNLGSFLAQRAFAAFRSTTGASLEIGADLTAKANWPADGFQMVNQEGQGTQGDVGVHWIAFQGNFQSKIAHTSQPVAGSGFADQDLDAGFVPKASIFVSDFLASHAAASVSDADGHGMVLGAYDGTTQAAQWWRDDDGANTSVAKNLHDATRVLLLPNNTTASTFGVASASYPNGNTVRLSWASIPASVRAFGWAALGDAPGAPAGNPIHMII